MANYSFFHVLILQNLYILKQTRILVGSVLGGTDSVVCWEAQTVQCAGRHRQCSVLGGTDRAAAPVSTKSLYGSGQPIRKLVLIDNYGGQWGHLIMEFYRSMP